MPPPEASEFAQIRPGLWVWQAYDSAVKTDLFSTAIATDAGLCLVDPIPLAEPELSTLTKASPPSSIVITNANHQRAALDYAGRFSVPVLGHLETLAGMTSRRSGEVPEIASSTGLEPIEIEGAVAGEIALYQPLHRGTLIVGDALINLDGYGFTFLPSKYCLNQKQMRRSLRKLLSLPVERILFAHGTPIVSRAAERLQQLLKDGSSS
jgi:glyoxylase-like metal-dependent hydrolase (beta-lactamase superfamily II)